MMPTSPPHRTPKIFCRPASLTITVASPAHYLLSSLHSFSSVLSASSVVKSSCTLADQPQTAPRPRLDVRHLRRRHRHRSDKSPAPRKPERDTAESHEHRFPPQVRKEILRIAEQTPVSAGDLSQLNFRLGAIYAEAALTACKRFRVSSKKIAILGNHGQTIFHQGPPIPYLGRPTASTLQIGDGNVIAARTGITTVSDFRPADVALGGQGAPLVPYADYLLYRHPKLGRVSLNLGGIANITVLPAACKPSQVFAFDTGPANILIDAPRFKHFTRGRQRFDKDAKHAQSGRTAPQRSSMSSCTTRILPRKPPKSTGREYYGTAYVKNLLSAGRHHHVRPADLVRAVTVFTALSVIDTLDRFVLPQNAESTNSSSPAAAPKTRSSWRNSKPRSHPM